MIYKILSFSGGLIIGWFSMFAVAILAIASPSTIIITRDFECVRHSFVGEAPNRVEACSIYLRKGEKQ